MAKHRTQLVHISEGGKSSAPSKTSLPTDRAFLKLLGDVRAMIDSARRHIARAVDAGMVLLYWNVGRRI
jgi:hypothetical protein